MTTLEKKIQICIIEDHKLMRDGIRFIINDTRHLNISAEFDCLKNFINMQSSYKFDLILLDLSLPDSVGITSIETIKKDHPETPILILTMHNESEFGIRAMQSGAHGYITKDNAGTELITAIDTVISGKKYISREFSNLIAMNTFGDTNLPLHHQLSKREFEVFMDIVTGLSSTEISIKLDISIKTVSTYRNRILTKLALDNNADLIRYAIQNNLTK